LPAARRAPCKPARRRPSGRTPFCSLRRKPTPPSAPPTCSSSGRSTTKPSRRTCRHRCLIRTVSAPPMSLSTRCIRVAATRRSSKSGWLTLARIFNQRTFLEQAVASFPSADLALAFVNNLAGKWKACAGQTITVQTIPTGRGIYSEQRYTTGNLIGEVPRSRCRKPVVRATARGHLMRCRRPPRQRDNDNPVVRPRVGSPAPAHGRSAGAR
jgi:PknH-like extracellular domain